MKGTLSMAAAVLAVIPLGGCGEDSVVSGNGAGHIDVAVGLNPDAVASGGGRGADAPSVTAADLALRLTADDGSYSGSWDSAEEFPSDKEFKAGQYTLEAFYGTEDDEGFGKPYYYGVQNFSVTDAGTTHVSLTAMLANAMISVDYTDAFKGYMSDYSVEIHPEGGGYIYYTADETRPVYVRPGQVSMSVSVTKPNGTSAKLQIPSVSAAPRHHYHVTIDVNGGEAGNAVLSVTFDDMLDQEDTVIDLSDELMNAPEPVIKPSGFMSGVDVSLKEGSTPASELKMDIIAKGGISSVRMTTSSPSLLASGWPSEVDLTKADASQKGFLSQLGLKAFGIWNNPDIMGVLDFTEVISHMSYIDGKDNTNTFTVTVTDLYGKMGSNMTLSVTLVPLNIEIAGHEPFEEGSTEVVLSVRYDGPDFGNDVKFYISEASARNGWREVAPISWSAAGGDMYTAVLPVTGMDGGVSVKARAKGKESGTVVVPRSKLPFELAVAANDVFAKHAVLGIKLNNQEYASKLQGLQMRVSSDGGATYTDVPSSVNGLSVTVNGLNPATVYNAVAVIEGKVCLPVSFSTEQAAQLPYSDMEQWDIIAGGSKYWWKSYLGPSSSTPWGTMNLVTTSAGGSSTNMFNHNGCAYVARSGTDRVDDVHSGNYAAVVKTIGWGYSDANGGMNAKELTVGSLHLGSTPTAKGQGIDYGMSFASRPASMTFWYKYVPRNSADYGYVEIWVKDAAGNVIARKESNIESVGQYTEMTLELDYPSGASKASQICVVFRSSNNPDCQTITNENLTKPPFGNLDDGKYEGALLYIDDIKLNY